MREIMPGIFVESDYAPCNLALVRMDTGVLAFNMPLCPNQAQAWLAQAEALVGEVRYVVLLDARVENVILTAALDIPVIATEMLMRQVESYEERSWRELLQAIGIDYPEDAQLISRLKPRKPALAFTTQFRLYQDKGGSTRAAKVLDFEAIPGIAPGSLWLFIPEHGVLFTGDCVTIDEPPPMELVPDLQAWFQVVMSLNRRADVRYIVPGRGRAPISRWEIEQQLEFMRTAQQTAFKLSKRSGNIETPGLTQAAQDLGQAFYNHAGIKGVQQIKVALRRMIQEH
ncbi:MAG: hypothetical protein JXA33_14215 [Anaerolineae bacterium]|nr:hypothetical protein [Anaerolineae bacterium]